jgi:hypothetical protein
MWGLLAVGAALKLHDPGQQLEGCQYKPPCVEHVGCSCYTNQCLGGLMLVNYTLEPLSTEPQQLGCSCCSRSDGWLRGRFPGEYPDLYRKDSPAPPPEADANATANETAEPMMDATTSDDKADKKSG